MVLSTLMPFASLPYTSSSAPTSTLPTFPSSMLSDDACPPDCLPAPGSTSNPSAAYLPTSTSSALALWPCMDLSYPLTSFVTATSCFVESLLYCPWSLAMPPMALLWSLLIAAIAEGSATPPLLSCCSCAIFPSKDVSFACLFRLAEPWFCRLVNFHDSSLICEPPYSVDIGAAIALVCMPFAFAPGPYSLAMPPGRPACAPPAALGP
mmetsp:Transcript_16101/g.41339  ORF Transcript_16101/g.41339 Transcript_16101/m.41339 type:complete len:208 (-) Transcript_16101:785-1408(-)